MTVAREAEASERGSTGSLGWEHERFDRVTASSIWTSRPCARCTAPFGCQHPAPIGRRVLLPPDAAHGRRSVIELDEDRSPVAAGGKWRHLGREEPGTLVPGDAAAFLSR
jgi:hypothetical protein